MRILRCTARRLPRAAAVFLLLCPAAILQGAEVANSVDDWSVDGIQGENSWFYGYYNLTLDEQDGDGVYGVDDFEEFLNDDSQIIEPEGDNHWNGNQFLLFRDTAPNTGPWTRVSQEGGHPNGTNSAAPVSIPDSQPEEHWSIRRWVADSVTEPTDLTLTWNLSAQNTNGGGGTGGILFLNGSELDSFVVGGVDAVGVNRSVRTTIQPNDIVDLALTPENQDGSRGDGADGSLFGLIIDTDAPPPPPADPIADSIAEFSDVQGQDNWFYGYYDLLDDVDNGNGTYESEDFIEFLNDGSGIVSDDPEFGAWKDSENHWDGGKWDLLANAAPVGHGPWTQITADGGHPAANAQGDEEVHWNIRRWESETSGEVQIKGVYHNTNGAQDGTIGRIFVDGEEVWSELSNGDLVEIDFTTNVTMGALVDFATDPDGSEVYDPDTGEGVDQINDGNDGTLFNFTITPLSTTVALQAGDADQNLEFEQNDLVQVLAANKYLTGNPATWGEGDWDGAPGGEVGSPPAGNGLFDQTDIVKALAAGTYLTGPYAAVGKDGVVGDDQTSLVYDTGSGELSVDAPAGKELTSINITSAGAKFIGDKPAALDGAFDNFAADNVFKATFGGSFGSITFGNVLPAGLGEDEVSADLSAVGSLAGGGDLGDVDLVYIPEPSSLLLLTLAAICVGLRRRCSR